MLRVPRQVSLTRTVAGMIPDGWSADRYGIPRELSDQVDRVTLYNLITTAEAFLYAGMEPFELYEYLHPSQVGTTSGSGMGGLGKLKRMFTDHGFDRERQHDVLQETLINVTAAYGVSAYVGATGPIQTPVAACATAGVSIDMAVNLIEQGKARFMIAGAQDDISEESMLGFADMGATAATDAMAARGISPRRTCRPNDSRRGGFVEGQGGGTVLLARGDLARDLGLPVYGIVACSATHSDGIQASVPAPGQGLLATARKNGGLPLADKRKRDELVAKLQDGKALQAIFGDAGDELTRVLRDHLLHDYYKQEEEGPLQGALGVFGLSADDIAVVYKHDTSTQANDINENRLHHRIQNSLGRTPGNPLVVVSQKSLTGHAKGGAASFQLNGLLQCMNSGVIPGNRNLDEVDERMNDFDALCFTDEPVRVGRDGVRAGLVTTLGFGHVGAILLLLHADYFLAALTPRERAQYGARRAPRENQTLQRLHEMRLEGGRPLYTRPQAPWQGDDSEKQILLDVHAPLTVTSGASNA